jgi:hypothetical protein
MPIRYYGKSLIPAGHRGEPIRYWTEPHVAAKLVFEVEYVARRAWEMDRSMLRELLIKSGHVVHATRQHLGA